MNAGGPAGKSFIDICVWPSMPDDNHCGQPKQQTSDGSPVMGVNADLLAGIPEPAEAVFKNENAIQENGRHFFYTATKAPADVVGNYEKALTAAGWTIEDSGGGGDPFGLFGSGGLLRELVVRLMDLMVLIIKGIRI